MISQLPPLYSAVKVNGKRLYEYARKGRDVDIPRRDVFITSLEVEDMDIRSGLDSWVSFSCECTKGTFIRSICHEAGEKLGVHAALSELVRSASGIFTEETAVTLDELRALAGYTRETEPRGGSNRGAGVEDGDAADRVLALLHSPDEVLGMFGTVKVKPKDAIRLINGLEIERAVYKVTEEPEYKDKDFYFDVRPEYRRMYRIYSSIPEDMEIPGRPQGVQWYRRAEDKEEKDLDERFIGLAVMNEENGHLIPEKIFI